MSSRDVAASFRVDVHQDLAEFIERQVRNRGFESPEAYLFYLVLDDEDRQEARQLAMEAFASGPGRFDREFLDAMQAYIEASKRLEDVGGLPA